MAKFVSPLTWYGGKGSMIQKLRPLLGAHHTYVEPFAGGAALFFAKRPSPVEVLNDIHGDLCNFYRVMQDPKKFAVLLYKVERTPYARGIFDECLKSLRNHPQASPIDRAYWFWVTARQSFGGRSRVEARPATAHLPATQALPAATPEDRCVDWLLRGLRHYDVRVFCKDNLGDRNYPQEF